MKLLVKPLAIIFYLKELLVKNWKFIQWPTYLTLGVGIFSIFLGSVVWEMYFSAIQFVLQLAMMLGFAIIQFVGIRKCAVFLCIKRFCLPEYVQ